MFLKDKTNHGPSIFFRSLAMKGQDVMLDRVKFYQSLIFEDLEKLVQLNNAIPKLLTAPVFR